MLPRDIQFQDALLRTVSGTIEEKVVGYLELIQGMTGFDAITLSSTDKKYRPVVGSIGHDPSVASFLSSDTFESSTIQRIQAARPNQLLAWEDVNFGATSHAQDVLVPSGFRNGVSVPVLRSGTAHVGMLHCNLANSRLDKSVFDCLLELRPVLYYLVGNALNVELPAQLSERERGILQLIAEGRTNPEIAEKLYLSRSTVATHVERILRKIQVSNRVQAAIWWDRHGSISSPVH